MEVIIMFREYKGDRRGFIDAWRRGFDKHSQWVEWNPYYVIAKETADWFTEANDYYNQYMRSSGPKTPQRRKKPERESSATPTHRRKTDVEPPAESKEPEPPDPDDPEPIDKMSKGIVSHNAQHCCVDMGGFPIPHKRFSYIDPKELGPLNKRLDTHTEILYAATNHYVRYGIIGDQTLSASGGTSGTPKPAWASTSGGNVTWAMQFNDTRMLRDVFDIETLTWPTYDYVNMQGVTAPGDSSKAVIIKQQYIELKFKNFGEPRGSGDPIQYTYEDCPAFITVYGYRLKDDVYIASNSAASSPISSNQTLTYELAKGWLAYYTQLGGSTYSYGLDQLYGGSVHDNTFLTDMCDCIGVEKHCLAMGQEGTMRFMLKKPQYFNFQDFAQAKPSGSTGYDHIAHRAGTIFFVYKIQGGITGWDNGTSKLIGGTWLQTPAVGLYATKRYEYHKVLRSTLNPTIGLASAVSVANAVDVDVDVEEYYSK